MSLSIETAAHLTSPLREYVRNLPDAEEILRKVTAKPLVKKREQWHEERVDQTLPEPGGMRSRHPADRIASGLGHLSVTHPVDVAKGLPIHSIHSTYRCACSGCAQFFGALSSERRSGLFNTSNKRFERNGMDRGVVQMRTTCIVRNPTICLGVPARISRNAPEFFRNGLWTGFSSWRRISTPIGINLAIILDRRPHIP
jgi:hypothetical protein